MTPESRAVLQRIGAELDGHRQLRVRIGGIVSPDTAPAMEAKETENVEREGQARPAAGSRSRSSRRQRSAGRSRPPGPAASVGRDGLRSHYEAQVAELEKAYPSAHVVASDEQGMWLLVESSVLSGIDRSATFLVAVPYSPDSFPRAWGFWNFASGPKWIGPRHVNFPDGSICAFVPESGTWRQGDRLDALLDLFTVWTLRQLYLEEFKRWPGRQFSAHPFYSLAEFKDDEFCSCDKEEPPRRYGECCKVEHLKRPLLELAGGFERAMGCRLNDRNPPQPILDFIDGRGDLPSIAETLGIPTSVG
jgi:hypothetical protein